MSMNPLPDPPDLGPNLTGLVPIAYGSCSTVYRADQPTVGRAVAVKVDNRTLDTEPDRRRFRYEARATGRVSGHPAVIDLFDAGVSADGHPYLVMELCTGSYTERAGRTSPEEVRVIGARIADALSAAHSAGVLHRDVKPGNILRTRFGTPVLADFGLAVLMDQRDGTEALDPLTPAYAPPESVELAEALPSGDVYSLAATMYALLAGHPPRLPDPGVPTTAVLVELYRQPVPDLPDVPPALLGILRRALATDPACRPSAAEFRDLLDAVPVSAAPATP
ncbi:MAG TPA: serine/threonine-protein kinase [Actinocatenispora sp.]